MSYKTFINDLEKLSNESKKNIDKEINKFLKGKITKDELLAIILIISSTYVGYAIKQAGILNKIAPEAIVTEPQIFIIKDLTINDRIGTYVDDLFEVKKRFIAEYGKNELGIGKKIFNDPRWIQLAREFHKEQVSSGIKNPQTSFRPDFNINTNIQGEIFFQGNYANSNYIKASGRGIIVTTQGDGIVCEQCKAMAGPYPPDYVFTGWHRKCRCYAVPSETIIGTIPDSAIGYMSEPKHKKWFRNSLFLNLNNKYYE